MPDDKEVKRTGRTLLKDASKKRAWIIAFSSFSAAALVTATAALCVTVLHRMPDRNPSDSYQQAAVEEGTSPALDPNAGEYEDPAQKDAAENVAIAGWGEIRIPAHETTVSVDLFNPEENKDRFFLTFELRIPDGSSTGYETIYQSGLVAAGLHVQEITLSRGLESGTYDAIVHVQPYDMDSVPTNNADLKTKLIVE